MCTRIIYVYVCVAPITLVSTSISNIRTRNKTGVIESLQALTFPFSYAYSRVPISNNADVSLNAS